jgi:ubiquinone/menaquinone biosynthesis C-methylase UbiE
MLKPRHIWKAIRNWGARYIAYTRAYSNSPEWPIVLRQRKPLFRRIAISSCQCLAQGTVLDMGTGPGTLPRFLVETAPNIRAVGIDIEPALLQDARRDASRDGVQNRASFLLADAHALPFSDGSFDMVLSIASLHLWHDRQKAINESYRVLRKGGVVSMLVGRRLVYPGKVWLLDFVTKRSAKYLKSVFEAAGFKEIRTVYAESSWLRIVARR